MREHSNHCPTIGPQLCGFGSLPPILEPASVAHLAMSTFQNFERTGGVADSRAESGGRRGLRGARARLPAP